MIDINARTCDCRGHGNGSIPVDDAARWRRYLIAWPLIPILFVGLIFRVQRLSEISYWFDESFCLKMAEFPIPELWERAANDPHPPLFYILLRPWLVLFGNSTLSTRMTSLFPGLLAIVGAYLLVREAYRDQVSVAHSRLANSAALLTAAVVALSPLHIAWSYQVRMYSLGAALGAYCGWFLLRALRRKSFRIGNWVCFTLVATALAYTHVFGMLTVAAQFAFVAGYVGLGRPTPEMPSRRQCLTAGLCSLMCVCLAWLPWLPSFLHQRKLVIEGFWTPPFSWEAVGLLFFELFDLNKCLSPSPVLGLIIGQVCLLALLMVLLGRQFGDLYLAVTAGLPFIAGIVVSGISRNVLCARYLMFAEIYLFAAICVLVCRIPPRFARIGCCALLLAGFGFLAWKQHQQRASDSLLPGMRGAMAHIDATRKAGEPLVVCDPAIFASVVAHTTKRQETFTFYPGTPYPFTHGAAVIRDDEYLSADELQRSKYQTVWAFDAETWGWKVPMPARWTMLGEKRFKEFNGVFVLRLYGRDPANIATRPANDAPASDKLNSIKLR